MVEGESGFVESARKFTGVPTEESNLRAPTGAKNPTFARCAGRTWGTRVNP
jgi:hypothetical protein